MRSSEHRVALAFLPAIVIHIGFLASLGVIFSLVSPQSRDVLPVMLLAEPPAKKAPEVDEVEPRAQTPRPEPEQEPKPRPPRPRPVHETTHFAPSPMEEPAEAADPIPADQPPVQLPPPDGSQPGPVAVIPESSGPPDPPVQAHEPVDDTAQRLAQIRTLIQKNLVYPPMAKIKGVEGTVKVRFQVASDGQPKSVTVAKSSGFGILDQAALATVKSAGPFPVVKVSVNVPVIFELD